MRRGAAGAAIVLVKFALACAYSSCGRHAHAEAPLRAALAALDSASGIYSPPPCNELLVDECTVTETSEASGSHNHLSAPQRQSTSVQTGAGSLCPVSDIADCDSDAEDGGVPELPVSRRSSGHGDAVIEIAGESCAPNGFHSDHKANIMLASTERKLADLNFALQPPVAAPVDVRVRARVHYLLALSLYMQGAGFAHLPNSRDAPHAACDAQRFVCVTEAVPADFVPKRDLAVRQQQLRAAARLLARMQALLEEPAAIKSYSGGAVALDLTRADAIDAQGRCMLQLGDAEGALQRHRLALHLRCRHLQDADLVTGCSCYHIGVAMAHQGVRCAGFRPCFGWSVCSLGRLLVQPAGAWYVHSTHTHSCSL